MATASSGWLEVSRVDPFNAVGCGFEAVVDALLARDQPLAVDAVAALNSLGSHAAIATQAVRMATLLGTGDATVRPAVTGSRGSSSG